MWPPPKSNPNVDRFFDALGNAGAEGCFNCLFYSATGLAIVIATGLWIFW